MYSGDISFEQSFAMLLPLELKQMVFKWAVMGTSNDIEIKSDRDNIVLSKLPVLEFLARLKESYPYDIYNEAIEYLTKPMFRWVFTSDSEPHRYLPKTFHRKAPRELRERIHHFYLQRIKVASLADSMEFPIGTRNRWDLQLPGRSDHSGYLQRIGKKGSQSLPDLILPILFDLKIGMTLLQQTLPSISKLDIGLDLYDCTFLNCMYHPTSVSASSETLPNAKLAIFYAILPLRCLPNISKLDIRVFWGDYFGQGNAVHGRREKDVKQMMQESFVQILREVVPTKCITSHEGHTDASTQ